MLFCTITLFCLKKETKSIPKSKKWDPVESVMIYDAFFSTFIFYFNNLFNIIPQSYLSNYYRNWEINSKLHKLGVKSRKLNNNSKNSLSYINTSTQFPYLTETNNNKD